MKLGKFEIVTGKVLVSDPCYDKGTWCQGILNNVRKGNWTAYVRKGREGRIAQLIAVADGEKTDKITKPTDFHIGVDSGQCGIFDSEHYQLSSDVKKVPKFNALTLNEDADKWYNMCCDLTLSEVQGGVIPYGCVSSTGWGDGDYYLYTKTKDKEIVGLRVRYM